MVNSAIVTIIDKRDTIIGDFELPVKITVDELSKKMIEFLKAKDSDTYIGLSDVSFQFKNRILDKSETLYENEVWDGSILKIIFSESYI